MSNIKLSKESQEVAEELIANGKQVFVNENGELFTKEAYAKEAKVNYEEYKGDAKSDEDKPNYSKMNVESLLEAIAERNLDLGEAKIKKDYVAILTAADEKAAADALANPGSEVAE